MWIEKKRKKKITFNDNGIEATKKGNNRSKSKNKEKIQTFKD